MITTKGIEFTPSPDYRAHVGRFNVILNRVLNETFNSVLDVCTLSLVGSAATGLDLADQSDLDFTFWCNRELADWINPLEVLA